MDNKNFESNKKFFICTVIFAVALVAVVRLTIRNINEREKTKYDNKGEIKEVISKTNVVESSYSLYKVYMQPYEIEFTNDDQCNLVDGSGNVVMESVSQLYALDLKIVVIENDEGAYIFDSTISQLSPLYKEVYKVDVEGLSNSESGLVYRASENDNWTLKTISNTYTNIESDKSISSLTDFDLSSGVPVIVEDDINEDLD